MQKNKIDVNQIYYGFKVVEKEIINEIEGTAYVLVHQKSGVNVVVLENEDPQMTFSVGFRTPPENNKGIPHILEHTVCCASEKYPLKETLTALEQGSICNLINACTYPDMTMYYAATSNEKDLMGISEVFIDMVFNPKIYSSPHYFKQEGWCYEVDEYGEFEYGGVVYNEMEGIYAEGETYLEREIYKSLFEGTCYKYDAGGTPDSIVKLSDEELLDFHRRYYRGDNCVIVFYGKGSVEDKLRLLDENSLGRIFNSNKICDNNLSCSNDLVKNEKIQQTPESKKAKIVSYPLEGEDEKYIISLSFLVNDYINIEDRLGLEILEHMLLKSAASPLIKRVITENNLGVSLSEGGYDTSPNKGVFSITLRGAQKDVSKQFKDLVYLELESLVKEGISKELLDASINMLKFSLKEKDAAYEPVGIQYSEMIMKNRFYGYDILNGMKYEDCLNKIISLKHEGYFERLISKYFLDNEKLVLITLEPSKDMAQKRIFDKYDSLEKAKAGFSKKELKDLIKFQNELKDMQLVENEYEELKILPCITKEDLPDHIDKLIVNKTDIEGTNVVVQEDSTAGISYVNFLFDTSVIPQEDIQYLGIIAHLFTYVGTKGKSYEEVENAINSCTGGLNCTIHGYYNEKTTHYTPTFKIKTKFLNENIYSWKQLMCEVLGQTVFEEKNKIKELLGNIIYEVERSFKGVPEYHSVQNIYTYISEEGKYINEVGGLAFYKFLKEIYRNFETDFDSLKSRLEKVTNTIFNKNNLTITTITSECSKELICNSIKDVIVSLPSKPNISYKYNLSEPVVNEAFIVEQELQAVAAGINFRQYGMKYTGDMEIVMNILESGYLWDRIRLQGGAYGTEISLSQEGYLVISTYCDPNIKRTLDVFDTIEKYLNSLSMEPEQFERYVVSTLGAFWAPVSMDRKIDRLDYLVATQGDFNKRDILYKQILNADTSIFKDLEQLFKQFAKNKVYSVIGNRESIEKDKNIFNKIYKNI